jgi:hypothetical protein
VSVKSHTTTMASLSQKSGIYVARFRYQHRQFSKSLKTADRRTAEAGLAQIRLAIHRLTVGLITLPPGVDLGDFILSGGTKAVAWNNPTVTPVGSSGSISVVLASGSTG